MPCAVNAESCIPKGEGTTESPYLIYTLEDLKRIGNDEEWTLDKHYKMMNDIVLGKPNETESTSCQNLRETANGELRRKFIGI